MSDEEPQAEVQPEATPAPGDDFTFPTDFGFDAQAGGANGSNLALEPFKADSM